MSIHWDFGKYLAKIVKGLENSSVVVSVWDGGKLIGLVRGLDDGVWEVNDSACEVEDIRILDLDGDGVQELIIQWTPVGEILVLHREDDVFYAWEIMYRGFEGLRTNGVYISSGGAGSNRWKRIRFENGSWLEEVLFEEDWGEFYINGESVDEETFLEQIHMIDMAEYVTRYRQSYQ